MNYRPKCKTKIIKPLEENTVVKHLQPWVGKDVLYRTQKENNNFTI